MQPDLDTGDLASRARQGEGCGRTRRKAGRQLRYRPSRRRRVASLPSPGNPTQIVRPTGRSREPCGRFGRLPSWSNTDLIASASISHRMAADVVIVGSGLSLKLMTWTRRRRLHLWFSAFDPSWRIRCRYPGKFHFIGSATPPKGVKINPDEEPRKFQQLVLYTTDTAAIVN